MTTLKMRYILLSAALLIIWGCGYTLVTKADRPFTSIRLGKIINTTSTPKLQDMLYEALAAEFLKRGVTISDNAPYTLEGRIYYYQLFAVAAKNTYASEYEVAVNGMFKLKDKNDNVTKEIKDISSPFIQSFESQEYVNSIIASKERQNEAAMQSLAAYLVYELMFSLKEPSPK
ncbi:MAG: LPS assembly lipoprotein LptE [Candidatus Magnetominusculus sp. LBB02]|nr:LPS assembly lipoprotein LptE [Candidatus Magnetominusculus sp. LBB02]